MSGDLSAKIVKRSVKIAGHTTSISIEDPFWEILQETARTQGRSLAALIAEVDEKRGTNLSSALRLYALSQIRSK